MGMDPSRRRRGRTVRVAVAFVCALAMVMTTAVSGAVFALDRVDLLDDGGVTLSSDGFTALQRAGDEIGGKGGTGALGSIGEAVFKTPAAPATPVAPAVSAGGENADASGGISASAYYSFPSFNPGIDVAAADATNAAQLSTTKAGGNITVTFVGTGQAAFFESCNIVDSNGPAGDPAKTPAVGTFAYIPTDYQDSFGHTQGYYSYYDSSYSNDYTFDGPSFTYSGSFTKAAPLQVTVYYQKWTVVPNMVQDPTTTDPAIKVPSTTQPGIWEPDKTTRYVKQFNYDLLGSVTYYEYERGKTFRTAWVKNGATYPKVTPKRGGGFKFNGWYTDFPKGTKVKVGSAKVWFGDKANKTLYVHWKKKVKVTYKPNGGKITKGKKAVTVNYMGKVGKAPTASRSGYHSLGWYFISKYKDSSGATKKNYQKHDKKLLVLVPKATFTAQWIKKGKAKTVSAAEWTRISAAYEKGLFINYKAVKAAIGGGGLYNGEKQVYIGSDGYYNYYINCKEYEWNGNLSGTIVKAYFSVKTGDLINATRVGGLK